MRVARFAVVASGLLVGLSCLAREVGCALAAGTLISSDFERDRWVATRWRWLGSYQVDPWGRPWEYVVLPGTKAPLQYSAGPDGRPSDGQGDDVQVGPVSAPAYLALGWGRELSLALLALSLFALGISAERRSA